MWRGKESERGISKEEAFMCNDPVVGYLKGVGYNVVRLPRRDFKPLQILSRQEKDLVSLGDLPTLLVAGESAPIPVVKENEPTTTISGRTTSNLSLGVGLSILGGFLGAMGGGKLGLDLKYKGANSLTFEFFDVLRDSVQITLLDQFLGAADVNPNSQYVGQLLEADAIYVVTETIKSRKFAVDAQGSHDSEVAIEVPEIQNIVGAKVKVSANALRASKLTFESSEPLVFGFQAVRLYYDEGRYTAFEPLASGQAAARELTPALPERVHALQSESTFARFSSSGSNLVLDAAPDDND
jgi:hypothetical protein